MEEAHGRRLTKYQELMELCRSQGWQACCDPTEVGCQGFAGRSLYKALTGLRITGTAKRGAISSKLQRNPPGGIG